MKHQYTVTAHGTVFDIPSLDSARKLPHPSTQNMAATVKEAVKESLVGTTREPQLSQLTKATFNKHATRDEVTGELFMTESDFVDAIAPKHEDYVRLRKLCIRSPLLWGFQIRWAQKLTDVVI